MKKLLLGTMILLSATLTTTNVKNVLAESTDAVTTEVINFVDNQHQINMGTFQKFAVFYLHGKKNITNVRKNQVCV